jgi:hypothetical protein
MSADLCGLCAAAAFSAAFGPGLARGAGSEILGSRALYNEISGAVPASSGGVAAISAAAVRPAVGGKMFDGISLGAPSTDDALGAAPMRVGTVSPLEDFVAQMRAAGANASAMASSTAQLREVILTLSADACSLSKGLDCLLEYRRQAIQRPGLLVHAFNAFMRSLRAAQGPSAAPPHGSMFWQRVVCTSTSLVTSAECSLSGLGDSSVGVTPQESEEFLRQDSQSSHNLSAAAMLPDADSDFDGLE